MAAAALRVTLVISRPSQVTWWEMEGGETCSTTARGKESRVRIYKSSNFSDFNIFLWVVFRRACIVGMFFLSCFLSVFMFVVEMRHLLQCLNL